MITAGNRPGGEEFVSEEQLAQMGDGDIAYVKQMRSEDIQLAFPQIGEIEPGLRLFALLSADGSPILLTDSKDEAIANAWEQDLETVSLH
ncbi:MAG: DUF1150 domain-containing protein [Beijerinckiaceae bacterium]|jgi:hypothetical protein|nr:DUF1150 domain-containing protein [Beijerinckiaceae bacterium]